MNERKFKGDVRDFQGESLTRKKQLRNERKKEGKKEKYEKEKKYEYA
jgi:hypothetical protein